MEEVLVVWVVDSLVDHATSEPLRPPVARVTVTRALGNHLLVGGCVFVCGSCCGFKRGRFYGGGVEVYCGGVCKGAF